MDALSLISDMYPDKGLVESTAGSPFLKSRITELQVHTLMSLNFRDHELWTQKEIYALLYKVSCGLNPVSAQIYPSRLSEGGVFGHNRYVHEISEE